MSHCPVFPKGWQVFPLRPGTKEPIHKGWPQIATDDPAQIAAWYSEDRKRNWAVAMGASALAAIDVDGAEGEASLIQFEIDHGFLPETREHATPHGRHKIFRDPEHKIRNSAGALGLKLDTRGSRGGKEGYVVIEPSVVDGIGYSTLRDIEPAVIPECVAEALGQETEAVSAPDGIELDDPRNISRAREYVRGLISRGDVAIEGSGGDNRTYQIICAIRDFGLSPENILEVITPWNEACQPAWGVDELNVKINNANHYAQNEAGAYAVPALWQQWGPETLSSLAVSAPAKAVDVNEADDDARLTKKFEVIRSSQFHLLKPPAYIVQNLIPEMAIILLYGLWGTFKSFAMQEMLGGVASGISPFGKYTVNKAGEVLLAAAEQPNAAAKVRFPAWCKKRGIEVANTPFHLMRNVPLVQDEKEVVAFVKSIQREKINPLVVGIDTLTRAMGGLDLNAPQAAGMMTKAADFIRDMLGCSVIMSGHAPKDKSKGAFGSIILPSNCDVVFEMDRPLPKGPAVMLKNHKMKEDDTNPDLPLCSEKYLGSLILNPISAAEFKKQTAATGPGADEALAGEILTALRSAGFVGPNVCSYTEMLNLVLSDRGELENDPKHDDKARERLRGQIRRARDDRKNETLRALGRKVKGQSAGLQWSAPAEISAADTGGDLGSLDNA